MRVALDVERSAETGRVYSINDVPRENAFLIGYLFREYLGL
jgi:hypothetical protein